MDVIIVDLILTDMVQRASMTTTHVMMIFAQEKKWSYIEQTLVERTSSNDFIPHAIEMFGYIHFRFDSFFTTCM